MTERQKKRLTTLYLFAFMAAFALSGTMFSTALPKIIDDYRLSLGQAGLFPVCTSAGNLLAMLLTGLVGDRLKKSLFSGAAFLGMGAMLLLISLTPPFAALLLLMTLLGVLSSALNLIVTAYVSDLYGERRSRYINLLHVCFGVGSLLGPLYPMLLGRLGLAWRYAYLGLAAAVLLCGGGYFLTLARKGEPAPALSPDTGGGARALGYRQLLNCRGMPALCLMSFMYMGGHQGAFSTWFQTYLQISDPAAYPEAFTSVCMTLYWVGMVLSRLLGAALPRRIAPRSVILCGSALGMIALTLGLVVGQRPFWPLAAAVLGMATGVIYPLTFAISCQWFPHSSARVSSFVGVFSSLGSLVFGYLVGGVAEKSFEAAMWIPVGALAAVLLIVLARFPRRAESQLSKEG